MVAKGTKRKVTEADVAVDRCNELAKAITSQANMDSDVVEMLMELLPHSLGQPKDKRHRFQQQAVLSVQRVMEGIEEGIKSKIEAARSKLLEARAAAAPSEAAVTEAEEKLRKDSEIFTQETRTLAKSALAFRTARMAVQGLQEAEKAGEENLQVSLKAKAKLQGIIDNFIKPLTAAEVPEADVEARCKSLTQQLRQLDESFDEAMLMVLGSSLAKLPAARGGFDKMAIEQLDKYMAEHAQPLDKTIDANELVTQERAAAVQLAKADLEGALQTQKLRSAAFEFAWNTKGEDKKALEAARHAVKDLAAATKSCEKLLYNAEAEMDVFEEFARKPFEELKERQTPEPVVELEQINVADDVKEDMKFDSAIVLPEAITA